MDQTDDLAVKKSLVSLVQSCADQVDDTYRQAIVDGMVDPVIFLLDCEDKSGYAIAVGWAGKDSVDVQIEASKGGRNPTATVALTRAVSFDETKRLCQDGLPYIESVFAKRPERGDIIVVVVAAGGASSCVLRDSQATPPNDHS